MYPKVLGGPRHVLCSALALCLLLLANAQIAHAAALQCIDMSPCHCKCGESCPVDPTADITYAQGRRMRGRINAAAGTETMSDLIAKVTAVAEQQSLATTKKLQPNQYPDGTDASTGEWITAPPGRWTCGFFPGVMWQLHSLTGKQMWADLATAWQADLADRQRGWISQLDLGFIYMPTFAHSYSVTHSPEDLRQAIAAAEALSWAFNPDTGTVKSWLGWKPPGATNKYQQIVIIDFIINVQALMWASKHVGPPNELSALRMDKDPATTWRNMAVSHARQVAANHVRPDGSTYHIVEYQPETAEVNKRFTYQGYADDSTWSRGQSWALLGFALMYNETGSQEFLAAAQKVTDKWFSLLQEQPGAPGDFIPVWDFNAPYDASKDGPRDSSVAGVAALAMLHLAETLGPNTACGAKYLCAAVNTLRALASPKYLATPGEPFAAIFKHAVSNFPDRWGIDVGLAYGDYYGMSAFAKCASMEACRSYAW